MGVLWEYPLLVQLQPKKLAVVLRIFITNTSCNQVLHSNIRMCYWFAYFTILFILFIIFDQYTSFIRARESLNKNVLIRIVDIRIKWLYFQQRCVILTCIHSSSSKYILFRRWIPTVLDTIWSVLENIKVWYRWWFSLNILTTELILKIIDFIDNISIIWTTNVYTINSNSV